MLLVTGATGFIGRNLVPVLARGSRLRILVRQTSHYESFKDNPNIDIAFGDLDTGEGLEKACEGVDTIIHCAVRTIGRNFAEYYRTNTEGTAHIVDAMNKRNITKILFVSSQAACGPCAKGTSLKECDPLRPVSLYGASKKLAEDIIRRSGLNYVILRPVAVYGPYDLEILKYIRILNHGICPLVSSGYKKVNLVYVADVVALIVKIIETGIFNNRTYFVHDGLEYSQNEIFQEITRLLNKPCYVLNIPVSLAYFFALLNDVFIPVSKRLIWLDKVREFAHPYWLCSSDSVKEDFGFAPTYTMSMGMKETIQWYKNQGLLK